MKGILRNIICLLFISAFVESGCYWNKNITRSSELENPIDRINPITILTIDSTQYKLELYALNDSSIVGKGLKTFNDSTIVFSGEIPLQQIAYIERNEYNAFKGIVFAMVCIPIAVTAIAEVIAQNNNDFHIWRPSENSSCPFIYSWDGEKYKCEGEAFGIGFGKALELQTTTMLSSLKKNNSELNIRITNERPETHYFNSIKLLAAEADQTASVVLDQNDLMWEIIHPVSPIEAMDHHQNVLSIISQCDSNYWESKFVDRSTYQDAIDLKFIRPKNANDASFIVNAINTEFVNKIFSNVFDFLGDKSLAFMYAVEHDSALIASLRNWIQEGSLNVFVLKNNLWKKAGAILPEANVVPFTRLVRINANGCNEDTIHIRLVSSAKNWKIDAAQIDWTPVSNLHPRQVQMISATGPQNDDISSMIEKKDSLYTVLFPTQKIDLGYKPCTPVKGKKIVYALQVCGYLHEWFPIENSSSSNIFSIVKNSIPQNEKISFIKNLIFHKEKFFPIMYSELN